MRDNDSDIATVLAQLDRALESPRVLAAKAVAEYRGRESGPVSNQHDDRGGRRLDVDACIQCSQPNHAPIHGPRKRLAKIPWWVRLLFWR